MSDSNVSFVKRPYLQNVTETSAVIMWQTPAPTSGEIRVGDRTLAYGEAQLHEIKVDGLKPLTEYAYAIDGNEQGRFKTLTRDRNASVHFVMYGDNRSNPKVHEKIAKAIAKLSPSFVCNSGDLVHDGWVDEAWDEEFFKPLESLTNNVPVFTAMGNHEINSPLYFTYLSPPNKAKYYSFDAGCVHVVVLDSNIRSIHGVRQQAAWLERDLAANDAAWTFVVVHHPPLSLRAGSLCMIVIDHYLPTLLKHGADFVFSAHDHYFKRTCPIGRGGNAITLFTSAGGGGHLMRMKRNLWDRVTNRCHHFCNAHASPDAITIDAFDEDEKHFDQLRLDRDNIDAYRKDATPLSELISNMFKTQARAFMDDIDEIDETLEIDLCEEPEPGRRIRGRVVLLNNPFHEILQYRLAWDTEGTSWRMDPPVAHLVAAKDERQHAHFTATIGDVAEPFPKLKFVCSLGMGKKVRGAKKWDMRSQIEPRGRVGENREWACKLKA